MPYATLPSKGSFARYWSWIFLNRVIHELLVSPSDGRYVSVTMPSMSWLGWLIEEPAGLGVGLQQAFQGQRVGADVGHDHGRREAELQGGQLEQRGVRGHRVQHDDTGLAAAMAVTWAVMSVVPGW